MADMIGKAKQHLDPATVCSRLLPDGYEERGEWVALNPTREDRKPGSFRINMTTGAWADFATNDKGTDTVSLWAYVRKINMLTAAQEILAATPEDGPRPPAYQRKAPLRVQWPLPDDGPPPPERKKIIHPELGKSPILYTYLTAEKRIIGYVARWEATKDTPKEIRPFFFAVSEDDQGRWRWCGPTGKDPRPLYGMERLGPVGKKVLLVEGEKTADAAHRILKGEHACLAWLGGASMADKVDLLPLQGRTVVLFPDFDCEPGKPIHEQPGMKAMLVIADKLLGLQCKVYLVRYTPGERVHGWDLADAEEERWDKAKVTEYINTYAERCGVKKADVEQDDTFGMFRAPSMIPVDMFDYLKTAGGKPLGIWQNVNKMLHLYGLKVRYNEMTRKIDFIGREDLSLEEVPDLCTINGIPAQGAFDKVAICASKNSYHPAKDWVLSKRWDGMKRIDALADSLGSPKIDMEFTRVLVKRWLVSAIAVLMQDKPDVNARGVLLLIGPQFNGKTTWVQKLAPSPMTFTGQTLDCKSRDSLNALTCAWITELGEVGETFKRSSQDSLKNFFSDKSDRIRLSYRRDWEDFPRRTVFAATSNDDDLLVDQSGNSRYYTIRTGEIERHSLDMQQVWAEVVELYRAGEPWHLSAAEMTQLSARNDRHMMCDAISDAIVSAIDWHLIATPDAPGRWLAPGEVLRRLRLPVTSGTARLASRALARLTVKKTAGSTTLYFLPTTIV